MDFTPFAYMDWAKAHYYDSPLSLVPSGMAPPPAELWPDSRTDALDPDFHEEELRVALSSAYGAEPGEFCVTQGSTQGALLAFGTLCAPGDVVLVEEPAYGLFASLASLVGAELRRFVRRPEAGFALEAAEVEKALDPRTRLVVLTTLHNPSGNLAQPDALRAVGELCAARGIHALASEVYVDFVEGFGGGRPRADAIHESFLATNSMTKVYGLGTLRVGWLTASREIVARCAMLRDVIAPVLPEQPLVAALSALRAREVLLARARAAAEAGRALVAGFVANTKGFRWVEPDAGITALVAVEGVGDTMAFSEWLREECGLGVVPGDFFGLEPGWLRVGFGIPTIELERALAALADGRERWLARS